MARYNSRRPGRPGGGIRQALWELLHPFRARRLRREQEQHARRGRERAGQKAEWRVRRELEKLSREPSGCYYVFSDLPTRHAGNIDHLVVGPEGLTAVETKANRGVVEVAIHKRQQTVISVGGKPLHRDLIRQVRSQMADVCDRAGMRRGSERTTGMSWVACFPAGKLGHAPSDLRPHLATTADLMTKVRAGEHRIGEEMVHSIASSIEHLYGKSPDAAPRRGSERAKGAR